MNYEDLTEEQKAQLDACKTTEEVFAFVKAGGFELTDKQLETISGGGAWKDLTSCPVCGGSGAVSAYSDSNSASRRVCRHCGRTII